MQSSAPELNIDKSAATINPIPGFERTNSLSLPRIQMPKNDELSYRGGNLEMTPEEEIQSRYFDCVDDNLSSECLSIDRDPSLEYNIPHSIEESEKKGRTEIMRALKRPTIEVMLNDTKIEAHIDSQSDYTIIREDVLIEERVLVDLMECSVEVRGIGGLVKLNAKFCATIEIDDDIFEINCYTMSKEDIEVKMIIGLDIINYCALKITPEGNTLKRWNGGIDLPRNRIQSIQDTPVTGYRRIDFILFCLLFLLLFILVFVLFVLIFHGISSNLPNGIFPGQLPG